MSETATANRTAPTAPSDGVGMASLVVILVLTNIWFFTQAFTYVHQ